MKIICIGRNYLEHARELKNPVPKEPVFFLKPENALVRGDNSFLYPPFSKDIHYETEIVYHVGRDGKDISEKDALQYVDGLGIGIDFTARDLQQHCKTKGLPWEISKAFDGSAPVSSMFLPIHSFGDLRNIPFSLLINGNKVQDGNTSDMIFPIESLISYVSRFITMNAGDLIFTGTPEGVGPVHKGDILEAFIHGDPMLSCRIV